MRCGVLAARLRLVLEGLSYGWQLRLLLLYVLHDEHKLLVRYLPTMVWVKLVNQLINYRKFI